MPIGMLELQPYAGPLGIRLPGRPLMTQGIDFVPFRGRNIGASMALPLTVLCGVDATFKEVPYISNPFIIIQYRNRAGYRVDFRTPNRGSPRRALLS